MDSRDGDDESKADGQPDKETPAEGKRVSYFVRTIDNAGDTISVVEIAGPIRVSERSPVGSVASVTNDYNYMQDVVDPFQAFKDDLNRRRTSKQRSVTFQTHLDHPPGRDDPVARKEPIVAAPEKEPETKKGLGPEEGPSEAIKEAEEAETNRPPSKNSRPLSSPTLSSSSSSSNSPSASNVSSKTDRKPIKSSSKSISSLFNMVRSMSRSSPRSVSPAVDQMTDQQLAEELYHKLGIKGDVNGLLRSLKAQRIREATQARKTKRDKVKQWGRKGVNLRTYGQSVRNKPQAAPGDKKPNQRRQDKRRHQSTMYPIHGVSLISGTNLRFSNRRPRKKPRSGRKSSDSSTGKTRTVESSSSSTTWLSSLLSETDKTLDDIDSEIDKSLMILIKNKLGENECCGKTTRNSRDGKWMEQPMMSTEGSGTTASSDQWTWTREERDDISSNGTESSFDDPSLDSLKLLLGTRTVGNVDVTPNRQNRRKYSYSPTNKLTQSRQDDYDEKKKAVLGVMEEIVWQGGPPPYDREGLNEILHKIENSREKFLSRETLDKEGALGHQSRENNNVAVNEALSPYREKRECEWEENQTPSPFAQIWIREFKKMLDEKKVERSCLNSDERRDTGLCVEECSRKIEWGGQEASSTFAPDPFTDSLEVTAPYEEKMLLSTCDEFLECIPSPNNDHQSVEEKEYKKLLDDQLISFVKTSLVNSSDNGDDLSLKSASQQTTDCTEFYTMLERSRIEMKTYTSSDPPKASRITDSLRPTCATITQKRPHITNSFLESACDEIKRELQHNLPINSTVSVTSEQLEGLGDKSSDFESVDARRSSELGDSFLSACSGGSGRSALGVSNRDCHLKLYEKYPKLEKAQNKSGLHGMDCDGAEFPPHSMRLRSSDTNTISASSDLSLIKDECVVREYEKNTTSSFSYISSSEDGSSESLWSCHSDQAVSSANTLRTLPFEDSLRSLQDCLESDESRIVRDSHHELKPAGDVSPPVIFKTPKSTMDENFLSAIIFPSSSKQTVGHELPSDHMSADTAISTESFRYRETDEENSQNSNWTGFPDVCIVNDYLTPPPPPPPPLHPTRATTTPPPISTAAAAAVTTTGYGIASAGGVGGATGRPAGPTLVEATTRSKARRSTAKKNASVAFVPVHRQQSDDQFETSD